jgi:hypothetical protein
VLVSTPALRVVTCVTWHDMRVGSYSKVGAFEQRDIMRNTINVDSGARGTKRVVFLIVFHPRVSCEI